MELDDKSCAVGVAFIKAQRTVHFGHPEGAHRQSEAVAFCEVAHSGERLEQVFSLLLGYSAAGVGDYELYVVGPRFLKSSEIFPPAGVYSAALARR